MIIKVFVKYIKGEDNCKKCVVEISQNKGLDGHPKGHFIGNGMCNSICPWQSSDGYFIACEETDPNKYKYDMESTPNGVHY